MPARRGYRVERLRRRRREVVERRQAWLLAGFAAAVAFAAVFGAWQLTSRLLGGSEGPGPAGRLVLITLISSSRQEPVAALLAVRNADTGRCSAYTIPAELLLEGSDGEYVFSADAVEAGTLCEDLQRVIGVPVDAQYSLPASALTDLAGVKPLRLVLEKPLAVTSDGVTRRFKSNDRLQPGELEGLLAAAVAKEAAGATLQAALVRAAVSAAAARPAGEAAAAVARLAAGVPADGPLLKEMLTGLVGSDATVDRLPSKSRVAEGQFAFLPDAEAVMADVTRNSSAFRAEHTVIVRNGTGKVGAGRAVARRLAGLDVNLAPVGNAATFKYRHTQILAGERALPVAQDIRAILGRGVVLSGTDVPAKSVVVIVGADLKLSEPTAKDQP